ncbi:Transcriptional regulator [Rubrivivax sp. A210]|uniref:LysR substrate-binding domain-containing protein n=1 Tax=Rubrivivax sp. A210 TaxID=2772301 RepID=UPI00191B3915|nr:LysR substrate-binding domain-containing protein [Rubrivivax sp. A210]CAD5366350.1 Transcriptional regulator [Rubrivivax sp. A210]
MAPARIPPIHCLETFEAVARLRSAARAAEELCVTPSAISHRLRQLEAQLGAQLFARADFSLTATGESYLARVRQGLQALQLVPDAAPGDAPARIRLATTPTFSRQVLLPRLALFRHAFPEVELVLQVSIPLLNVKAEDADLEIRFGTGPYEGVEQVRILSDEICPVASPEYINQAGPFDGFDSRAAVGRAHLIRSTLEPWSTWFQACGIALPEPKAGAQFNDAGLVFDAAAAGFGVALMRLKLGTPWLTDGRLVRLSPRAVPSPHHHFICWKHGTLARWECAAFVDWLQQALK